MLSTITTQFAHHILNEEVVIVMNPTKDLTKVQHYLTKSFHQDSVVCSPGSNDNEYFVIFTYTIDANRKTIRESIRTILEPFSTTNTLLKFQSALDDEESAWQQVSELGMKMNNYEYADDVLKNWKSDVQDLLNICSEFVVEDVPLPPKRTAEKLLTVFTAPTSTLPEDQPRN